MKFLFGKVCNIEKWSDIKKAHPLRYAFYCKFNGDPRRTRTFDPMVKSLEKLFS